MGGEAIVPYLHPVIAQNAMQSLGKAVLMKAVMSSFTPHSWTRDPRNPILPPGPSSFDATACMNPSVVVHDGLYWLFYAGGDAQGQRRICLATAPFGHPYDWTRHGPVLEPGEPGAFDEWWCVLPSVHRVNGRWHLYYTGRHSQTSLGLQSFTGIGLAVSDDLRHWQRVSRDPILTSDGFAQWPENKGIAGGGPILEIPRPDGGVRYRLYYTIANGIPHPDLLVHQEKHAVVAHSDDGIHWGEKQVILSPRREADYENAAVIALNPWPVPGGYRALYAGIGSRFGAYSICEASSPDGLKWERGAPGENLALPPIGDGWESEMTTYPHLVREGENLRLFYCGNGYGATGIGTALLCGPV